LLLRTFPPPGRDARGPPAASNRRSSSARHCARVDGSRSRHLAGAIGIGDVLGTGLPQEERRREIVRVGGDGDRLPSLIRDPYCPPDAAPARAWPVRSPLFRRASLITSFSNICSASSFFSRMFSASSSLSRLASGTLMPPNLLRHR